METDSSLSWLVLATSLVGFLLASVLEASLLSVRRERAQRLLVEEIRGALALESLNATPMGPAGAVTLLKFVFLTSSLLSVAALTIVRWDSWGMIALTGLAALALLGLTHIAARAVASVFGERVALRTATGVRSLVRVLRPLLATRDGVLRRVSKATRNGLDAPAEETPNDLGISVDAEGEALDEREVQMIRGVVQLDKTTAREIMAPRVDIVAVELGTPLSQVAAQMVESGHSRIPVYEGNLDTIKGIAYVRDILEDLSRNGESRGVLTESLIRPAIFIPESKNLDELLDQIQETRVHLAIVVDEYGGVSGLVTIEDLLEEIVGEIRDEFDSGEPEIEAVRDGELLIDARTGIDQLNELFDLKVKGDGFDTVGGLVYQRLGKIPSSGDTVESDGLKIEVVSTVGRRLKKLRVIRTSRIS